MPKLGVRIGVKVKNAVFSSGKIHQIFLYLPLPFVSMTHLWRLPWHNPLSFPAVKWTCEAQQQKPVHREPGEVGGEGEVTEKLSFCPTSHPHALFPAVFNSKMCNENCHLSHTEGRGGIWWLLLLDQRLSAWLGAEWSQWKASHRLQWAVDETLYS